MCIKFAQMSLIIIYLYSILHQWPHFKEFLPNLSFILLKNHHSGNSDFTVILPASNFFFLSSSGGAVNNCYNYIYSHQKCPIKTGSRPSVEIMPSKLIVEVKVKKLVLLQNSCPLIDNGKVNLPNFNSYIWQPYFSSES